MTQHGPASIPSELIEQKIYLIRGHKVMIDADLAELYDVTTGNLNLAVRRNPKRFPEDFMFQLSREEGQSRQRDALPLRLGAPAELPTAINTSNVAAIPCNRLKITTLRIPYLPYA